MAGDGRDEAAVALYARFRAGEVSREEMVAVLPSLWRYRSRADPLDDVAAWRAMVEHAGYFVWNPARYGNDSGRWARRPVRARRLFRGATPAGRFGMSWTAEPGIARHFAEQRQRPDATGGQVWTGVFAPSRLLAYLHDEREYLLDADGAEVTRWSADDAGLWLRLRLRT